MKYEITKGSEKDFDGIGNEDVVRVYDTGQTKFYAVAEEISSIPSDWFIIAERRPITEPVWSGEGLPPVGAQCEIFAGDAGWVKGEIMYNGVKCSLLLDETGEDWFFIRKVAKFRPIRSPEDVAKEKERSEQCDKIFGILSGVERTDNRSDMAEALYDAGYRKME